MVASSIVAASLIAGGASAGASIIGGKMASNAAKNSAKANASAVDKQIAFEREQADEDKRRWDETQAYNRAEAERVRQEELRRYEYERQLEAGRWDTEQARRTPYRKVSVENMDQLAGQTRGSSLADLAFSTRR